jgi:hypothetical protein
MKIKPYAAAICAIAAIAGTDARAYVEIDRRACSGSLASEAAKIAIAKAVEKIGGQDGKKSIKCQIAASRHKQIACVCNCADGYKEVEGKCEKQADS